MKNHPLSILAIVAFLTVIPVWCLLARASSTPVATPTAPQDLERTSGVPLPAEQPLALPEDPAPAAAPIVALSVACAVDGQPFDQLAAVEELNRLRDALATAKHDLEICQTTGETAEGAFVRLPEYEKLTPEERRWIRAVVAENMSVHLQPGEATWIAERVTRDDWQTFPGGTVTEVLLRYLGPQRVAAEAGPEKVAYWSQFYDPEEWAVLFGKR